jgi:hypothetical protein
LFGPGLAMFIAAWWSLVHSSLHISHINRPRIFSPSFHSRLHHEHDAVIRYSSTNTTPYPALLRMSHILLPFLLEVMRDPSTDKSMTLWTGDSERPVCTLRCDKYRSFSHQKENMVHQQRLDAEVETSCTSCHSGLAKLRCATTLRTI